jgi:hypothetical protein
VWLVHPWTVHSVRTTTVPRPRIACNPHITRTTPLNMYRGPSLLEQCIHANQAEGEVAAIEATPEALVTVQAMGADAIVAYPWQVALSHRRLDTMEVGL